LAKFAAKSPSFGCSAAIRIPQNLKIGSPWGGRDWNVPKTSAPLHNGRPQVFVFAVDYDAPELRYLLCCQDCGGEIDSPGASKALTSSQASNTDTFFHLQPKINGLKIKHKKAQV
jgi:hypothetical protein